MTRPTLPLASTHPDPKILARLGRLQTILLTIVFVLGATTLLGWVFPPLGRILPYAFSLMRANTALLITLSAVSVGLSLPRRSRTSVLAARFVGVFVAWFSILILLRDYGILQIPIETLLAPDASSIYPGKVSPEAAVSFLLLGLILIAFRARKSLLSKMVDGVTLALFLAMLNFLARYLFGLSHLFVLHQNNPFSIQTLLCLILLTVVVASRRAEYGVFAILLDSGTGGLTARFGAPLAVLLPFLIAVPKALLVRFHPTLESSSTAASTSILSVIAFCLVLVLAKRTEAFEAIVRELSLRDELTGLYNRRGFSVLAEQALQLAQRVREPFSVLFFDMDNLKAVNDQLGHEVGSDLLKEMAEMLVQNFRRTDVISRLGGDEFVVAGKSDVPEMANARARLEEAVARANRVPGRRYTLSFSLGSIDSSVDRTDDAVETLDDLLARADAMMYVAKRRKKRTRTEISVLMPKLIEPNGT